MAAVRVLMILTATAKAVTIFHYHQRSWQGGVATDATESYFVELTR